MNDRGNIMQAIEHLAQQTKSKGLDATLCLLPAL